MDPEFAAALAPLAASGPPRIPTLAEARANLDAVTAGYKAYLQPFLPPASAYTVKDEAVEVDGGQILVRCLIPVVDDASETFPVLVWYHGGAWSMGSIELDDYRLRILCVQLKLAIVNVEYRLAPEHPFPTPLEDSMAALKWTARNTSLLKVDLNKGFIVGGESAGGNLSASLAHIARDDPFFHGRPLTGQLLQEPLVVHLDAYPEHLKAELRSTDENADVPPMPTEAVRRLIGTPDKPTGWYNPPPTDPRFSPLLSPSFAGIPRTYIQAMGLDPLRDHALVYGKVLREAGVEVMVDLFPGVSHGFHYTFPTISAAVKVREDMVKGLEWLLGRKHLIDGEVLVDDVVGWICTLTN
ncbi:hypothetical protein OH77DRAFT_1411629 [Trametes cingulata]|nr:hypothetical protein OH77DRAFT_1411629 [Trametes cingulata]